MMPRWRREAERDPSTERRDRISAVLVPQLRCISSITGTFVGRYISLGEGAPHDIGAAPCCLTVHSGLYGVLLGVRLVRVSF